MAKKERGPAIKVRKFDGVITPGMTVTGAGLPADGSKIKGLLVTAADRSGRQIMAQVAADGDTVTLPTGTAKARISGVGSGAGGGGSPGAPKAARPRPSTNAEREAYKRQAMLTRLRGDLHAFCRHFTEGVLAHGLVPVSAKDIAISGHAASLLALLAEHGENG